MNAATVIAVLLTLAALAGAATTHADPAWQPVANGAPGVYWTETKIQRIVRDTGVYRSQRRICVRAEELPGCVKAADGLMHFDIPMTEDGAEMYDDAKFANAQRHRVLIHVDTNTRNPNPAGELRCTVTRLVTGRSQK